VPPLPVIDDVFRVAVHWRHGGTGQIAVNVMHFRSDTGTSTSLAAALQASVAGNQFDGVSSGAVSDDVAITPLDGLAATSHFVLPAWVGQGTGGDYSPASSAVLAFQTAKRGRSFRGRIYLPFLPETQMSDGALTGGVGPAIVGAWTAFNASMLATGDAWVHVVASYKHASAEPILGYTVMGSFGTQRRRQTRIRYP